ncbi:MAG TPA: antitoxin Xre-like helix-turn-helix domain-containing protein [Sediminibacterium sp.]|nr:antitoxin Xre-like helix-turn-helix domain-containing protein [Sediminibacterium sp.]
MAKMKKYTDPYKQTGKVAESHSAYLTASKKPMISEFNFRRFKKLADKMPFTQGEWSQMLHISERTLQRYAKQNGVFDGLHTDRILLLDEMIHAGLETFADADRFYHWLKTEKSILGRPTGFEALFSEKGIQAIIDQLGRIQSGVYA